MAQFKGTPGPWEIKPEEVDRPYIRIRGTHKGGDIIRGDFSLERVRPLRTEAERAIDEMVQLSGVSIGAAKILYDAGYRK